jgi:hypothetical protein
MRPIIAATVVLLSATSLADQPTEQKSRLAEKIEGVALPMPDAPIRKLVLQTDVVGWKLEGGDVELTCDKLNDGCGLPVFRSRGARSADGRLVHREAAWPWRGMELTFAMEARAGRTDNAHLYFRVTNADGKVVLFEEGKPLHGTTRFGRHTLTVTIPDDADRLEVGLALVGQGAVFVKSITIDEHELATASR